MPEVVGALVDLIIRAGDTRRCVQVRFHAKEWEPPAELDDASLRGAVPNLAPALAPAVGAVARVRPSSLVARAVATGVSPPDGGPAVVRLLYEHPDPKGFAAQYEPEKVLAQGPEWITAPEQHGCRPAGAASSHIGNVPLLPPLAVLCGYRPFFARPLFKQLAPLRVLLADWCKQADTAWQQQRPAPEGGGEAAAPEASPPEGGGAALPPTARMPPLWHYSRFAWAPPAAAGGGREWCGTFLFYSSILPVGPLNLYPLYKDGTLADKPPRGGDAAFTPSYIRLAWRAAPRGDECVLRLGDVVKDMSENILLRPEYGEFADFVAAHGLTRPDPELFLRVGLEKTLIAALHFFPLVPIVGFTYDHTFSAVPEPMTLCLTAPNASRMFEPELGGADAAALLACAQACERGTPEGDLPAALDALPAETVEQLFLMRHHGHADDTALGEYVREHMSPAAARYLLRRSAADRSGDAPLAALLRAMEKLPPGEMAGAA